MEQGKLPKTKRERSGGEGRVVSVKGAWERGNKLSRKTPDTYLGPTSSNKSLEPGTSQDSRETSFCSKGQPNSHINFFISSAHGRLSAVETRQEHLQTLPHVPDHLLKKPTPSLSTMERRTRGWISLSSKPAWSTFQAPSTTFQASRTTTERPASS